MVVTPLRKKHLPWIRMQSFNLLKIQVFAAAAALDSPLE
jgi:hypothetical protein